MMKFLIIPCCALALSACGSLNTVKPWDKDILARPEMSLADSRTGDALDAHVYFSKEASSGGAGMGGGGCGCN